MMSWPLVSTPSTQYSDVFFFSVISPQPTPPPLFPYTTLFRSAVLRRISRRCAATSPSAGAHRPRHRPCRCWLRSEEHTSELQSQFHLVCRLLLEKKNHDCGPAHCERQRRNESVARTKLCPSYS